MLVTAPLICFALIFLCVHIRSSGEHGTPCLRVSFLTASLIWAVLLTVITEVLSLFGAITFGWVSGLWGAAVAGTASACFVLARKNPKSLRFKLPAARPFDVLLLIGTAFIAGAACLAALVAPPNGWDPMISHMSRAAHWMQNHSVEHYPTNVPVQLYLGPFAEFVILHLQILSGGDRFANLVQWVGMMGGVIGVSLVARELGAAARGQVLAAVVAATIPMGVLQASGAQNSHVVAFWLVCCIYYLMRLRERPGWGYALGAGVGLGLAVLTKPTAYLFAPPLLVWLGIWGVRSHGRRWLQWAAVAATAACLVNAGFFARNIELFGRPLSPPSEARLYLQKVYSVRRLASKAVWNLGLHMGTPSSRANAVTDRVLRSLDAQLDLGVADPRQGGGIPSYVPTTSFNEALDGNPVHLVLVVVCLGIILLSRNLRGSRGLAGYSVCMVAAFLLFSAYVVHVSWNSRRHLPLFVLWSPVIGTVLSSKLSARATNCIALTLILLALPWVLLNKHRPLVGKRTIFNTSRTAQYFAARSEWKDAHSAAAKFVTARGCSAVGLWLRRYDWEYPFWVLLRGTGGPVRIEHVNVSNVSARKADGGRFRDFRPDVVLSVGAGEIPEVVIGGETFKRARSWGAVGVFIKE